MNRIGITYDEAPFRDDAAYGIRSFAQIGFTHFELAVDPIILPLNVYKSTFKIIDEEKCSFSFHVPNFLKERKFRPQDFRSDGRVIDCYIDQFETVSLLADSDETRRYVIHGWEYDRLTGADDIAAARDGMASFLDAIKNHIERRRLPLELYIENAYSPSRPMYPERMSEVEEIVSLLDGYGIKPCLDIPHYLTLEGSKDVVEAISPVSDHIHVHGLSLSPYSSHFPLSAMADGPLREAMMDVLGKSLLPDSQNAIIVETLGMPRDEYISSAAKDLAMIREAIGA